MQCVSIKVTINIKNSYLGRESGWCVCYTGWRERERERSLLVVGGGVIGVGRGRENVKVVGSGDFLLF